ncbi:38212_t:CDS:1, partial [Gigaspora margarita]
MAFFCVGHVRLEVCSSFFVPLISQAAVGVVCLLGICNKAVYCAR